MIQISAINEELKNLKGIEELECFILKYSEDARLGVQQKVSRAYAMKEALINEIARVEQLKKYEKEYEALGYVAGVDEVGRGPLAGPVVTAAVILPKDCDILYINDSKKLSEKKREELYDVIMEKAVSVSIAFRDCKRIDEINILNATLEAMQESVEKLSVKPSVVLVDAVTIPNINIKQVPIIKGDAKSISIGAASIVAKVTRDRLMKDMDIKYPGYDFASNKGYGSEKHIAALKKIGPSEIHRKSFIGNFV